MGRRRIILVGVGDVVVGVVVRFLERAKNDRWSPSSLPRRPHHDQHHPTNTSNTSISHTQLQ